MHRLRVISPFLALHSHDDRSTFFTIPVGSIVLTESDLFQPGLVPISLGDEQLLAFARDVTERTETFDLSLHKSSPDNGDR
jgi:hypothetical protein